MLTRTAWPTGRLGEHAYIKARIGWRGLSSNEYTHDGPYLIAGNHIAGGRVNWPECDHISMYRYVESREIALRPGDVILTKDGTIGRVAILDTLPGLATINGTMMLVRPHMPLVSRYVYHYLTGAAFQKLVTDKVSGSSIPHIFQRDMQQLPIPVPPLAEQRRIADILDTADAAIQQTETLIAKLKLMRAGLLHDLLTRGLEENGELRDPVAHPEQFKQSALGRIPFDWVVCTFEALADIIDPQPDHRAPAEVQSGEPYIGVGDFFPDGSLDLRSCRRVSTAALRKQQQRFLIADGDILFGKIGTIGQPRMLSTGISYALNANTVLIKPKSDPFFVLYLLQSEYVENHIQIQIHSTSQPAFGIQRIRAMYIPLPSPEEQKVLAQVIKEHDARIHAEVAYRDKLKLMKQGLMDDLLTGRVRVPVEEGVTA